MKLELSGIKHRIQHNYSDDGFGTSDTPVIENTQKKWEYKYYLPSNEVLNKLYKSIEHLPAFYF